MQPALDLPTLRQHLLGGHHRGRRSTSAGTSASSSRRPPTTRGPAWTTSATAPARAWPATASATRWSAATTSPPLSPTTGKALEWNPTGGSNSFEGDKAMEATPRGLFIGGDGMFKGGVRTGRVGVLRLQHRDQPGRRCPTPRSPPRSRVAWSPTTRPSRSPARPGSPPAASAGCRCGSRTATAASTSPSAQHVDQHRHLGQRHARRRHHATGRGPWATGSSPPTATCWSRRRPSPPPPAAPATPPRRPRRSSRSALDDQTPTTSITGPSGIQTSTTFTVTGTANDDKGVNSLTLLVPRRAEPLPAGRRHGGRHLQHLPRHPGRHRRDDGHLVLRGDAAARGRVARQRHGDRHHRSGRPAQRHPRLDRRLQRRRADRDDRGPGGDDAAVHGPGRHRRARWADHLRRHRRPTTRASRTSRSPCATAPPGRTSATTAPGALGVSAGNCRISPVDIAGSTYNWT